MKSTPEIISEGMAECGEPILLIGGMALPAYDVIRQTVDMDFLISTTKVSILHDILVQAGYKEMARTVNFVRYTSSSVYHYDVDVLLVDDMTFENILSESQLFDEGRSKFHIPSIEHMLMLKLHAMKNNSKRELKDLNDVVEILRSNPDSVCENTIQSICEKYGPEGTLEKLKDLL